MYMKDLEDELANNRIRRYMYILKVNEDTIAKKVFNVKLKEKCLRG